MFGPVSMLTADLGARDDRATVRVFGASRFRLAASRIEGRLVNLRAARARAGTARTPRAALLLVWVAGVLLAFGAPAALGHPGRLDAKGCHMVRDPVGYTYQSGRILAPGSRHCHRQLSGDPAKAPRLDGSHQLADPPAPSPAPHDRQGPHPDRP